MEEKVNDNANCDQQEFYFSHKAVTCENAESTKLWIIYDACARENSKSLSVNDCLERDPTIPNLLWSLLIRTRFKPIALCGNLQIWIKKRDRHALRFHWVWKEDPKQIEVLRFTRLGFGLVQSPFILQGAMSEHLLSYTKKYSAEVAEIRDDLYVDDLITGSENFEQLDL